MGTLRNNKLTEEQFLIANGGTTSQGLYLRKEGRNPVAGHVSIPTLTSTTYLWEVTMDGTNWFSLRTSLNAAIGNAAANLTGHAPLPVELLTGGYLMFRLKVGSAEGAARVVVVRMVY